MLSKEEFRDRLISQRTIWAAGAHDALCARMIETAGFDAILASGFGISASVLGQPDLELYTMTENLAATRGMISAVDIPVVADIDTGFGNVISVMRTVREFESAGASALILEDQVSPKQCPMLGDPAAIPLHEAVVKLRGAVAARRDPNLVIVGRTDSLDKEDMVSRARAYAAAGADLIQPMLRAFKSYSEVQAFREACGVPLSLQINGVNQPEMSTREIESVAGIATWPIAGLLTAAHAMQENLKALAQTRSLGMLPRPAMSITEFQSVIGFDTLQQTHRSLRSEKAPSTR